MFLMMTSSLYDTLLLFIQSKLQLVLGSKEDAKNEMIPKVQ